MRAQAHLCPRRLSPLTRGESGVLRPLPWKRRWVWGHTRVHPCRRERRPPLPPPLRRPLRWPLPLLPPPPPPRSPLRWPLPLLPPPLLCLLPPLPCRLPLPLPPPPALPSLAGPHGSAWASADPSASPAGHAHPRAVQRGRVGRRGLRGPCLHREGRRRTETTARASGCADGLPFSHNFFTKTHTPTTRPLLVFLPPTRCGGVGAGLGAATQQQKSHAIPPCGGGCRTSSRGRLPSLLVCWVNPHARADSHRMHLFNHTSWISRGASPHEDCACVYCRSVVPLNRAASAGYGSAEPRCRASSLSPARLHAGPFRTAAAGERAGGAGADLAGAASPFPRPHGPARKGAGGAEAAAGSEAQTARTPS